MGAWSLQLRAYPVRFPLARVSGCESLAAWSPNGPARGKRRGSPAALTLAVHEYVPGDLSLLLVQVQNGALQHAVGIGAARVHGQGPAELLDPPALQEFPVHRQHRLVL